MTKEFPIQRKLAAVFAADVEGFSRLMSADEDGTLRLLAAQRRILDDAIKRYRGRIANTAGDSVLAEFPSVSDAVQCAVEAQDALRHNSGQFAPDRRVQFRIGIHLGDVATDGDDLLGNGVNIASRLQGIAAPNGVVVSSVVHDQVRKTLRFAFVDLGEQQLKGVDDAIRAFALEKTGHDQPRVSLSLPEQGNPLPLPDKPSIAVLPFQNMSGDPEQDYFADGMVEDIITALSRFKSLFVIARNSSFTYKGRAVDIKQVGRELGVRYVLEGSVRKAGGRVRITGQLIEAATGAHLWADRFEGTIEDVFDLQDKVTEQVVGAIAPRVQEAEIERATQKPTAHLDAYDCLLRGWHSFQLETNEGYDVALEYFQKTIALDTACAVAYALAARTFSRRAMDSLGTTWPDAVRLGEPYIRKAISLGQNDDAALTHCGIFVATALRDSETARNLLDRALLLNPNLLPARTNRAWVSIHLGDHDDAMQQLEAAHRLSPVDPMIAHVETAVAYAQFFLHNFENATHWAGKALARKPNHVLALRVACSSMILAGHAGKAQAMLGDHPSVITSRSISEVRDRLVFRRKEDVELWCESIRRLGLPE